MTQPMTMNQQHQTQQTDSQNHTNGQLQLTATLTIDAQAQANDSGGQQSESMLPRFSMLAYTGGPMRLAGWKFPVIVDLAGLAIPSQIRPIRVGHDTDKRVGHTHAIRVDNNQLVAEGVVSCTGHTAKELVADARNGFPWQASIGASVEQFEFFKDGQVAQVNGRQFTGPVNVVRRATLGEISFVDLGADGNTSANVAASAKENSSMNRTNGTSTLSPNTDASNTNASENQAENASAIQAQTPTPTALPSINTNNVPEAVADIRAQVAAESKRIAAIRQICNGKFPTVEAQAIEEGWDTTKTELHVLRASRPNIPVAAHGAGPMTQRPNNPQVYEAVALMASGLPNTRIEAMYAEPVLEAADKLRGIGVQEFCELVSGQQLPRFRRDATGWLQAAFSTASLPGVLSNIANKMLLEGYNYVEDAWRRIAKIASVNDFKEHSRYRMTGAFKFEQVGPDGELKHGKLDEQKFGQRADTHGIMFALTRQMIINDDMGAFTDIPRQIGMGAAEAIADAVWGLWLRNPNQSDNKSFFHADHNNYLEGVDTALSVDGLTAAEVKFSEQIKPNGKPLGMPANILLVPTALKVAAELLMKSIQLNETTTANKAKPSINPHVGKFDVVSSVYLANASFTGASSKAWYLLADPNRLPSIEVAFLNGVDRPTVEKTDADFNTLGIQFRGYIDFGVREQDHRGALKMKGEA
jgi:hypothetical protein